jgi:hypothetical protein
MVRELLKRFKHYISSSSVEEVEERMKLVDLVKEVIQDHKDEREFFRSWLTGFQTPAPAAPKRADYELLEALEDEARLGNTLAQDIVADDEKMAEYIKLHRENY